MQIAASTAFHVSGLIAWGGRGFFLDLLMPIGLACRFLRFVTSPE
jgi:hypothetical protein